jgi:hypothetical protein
MSRRTREDQARRLQRAGQLIAALDWMWLHVLPYPMWSNDAARDVYRTFRRCVRVGCWVVVAAAACGKTAPNGEGALGGMTAMEGCDALAEAATAYVQKCVPSKTIASAIAQRFAGECKMVAGAPGVTGLGATLAACEAAYASAAETCAAIDAAPCSPPMGALAGGAPCGADAQCASGLCSVSAGGIDAPSAYYSFVAAQSATTPAAGVTRGGCGTCAPTAMAGQPCNGTCTSGLVCQQGACAPPPPPGAVGESCVDQACKKGLQCDPLKFTCAVPPAEGEACVDPHTGVELGCVAPFVCQHAAMGAMGTCVRGSAEGGPCAPSGQACARGLQCEVPAGADPKSPAGTCSPQDAHIPAAGQPCDGAQPCAYGVCASGTCPFPIPEGQACDANDQRALRAPCNYFSECIAGICVLFDPGSCK